VRLGDWLGLQAPATENEILHIVEGNLAPAVIKRLILPGLRRSEIDALIIPVRVIRVISLAESVYGSRERALAWLRNPHSRRGRRMPLSLLNTDTGSRIVEEMLVQIDEGMFV
jgi:putative toxin-antitoxin system antitoxin component (TIGR02293 family)